jgi:hypothetical protein
MKNKIAALVAVVLMASTLFAGCIKWNGEDKKEGAALEPTFFSFVEECLLTMYEMCNALISEQILDLGNPNFGALRCLSDNPDEHPLHTRAGEAVYPLAVAYRHSGKELYCNSAVALGNWLVSQQNKDGSWDETPGTWKGTTADQCISLAEAYRILKQKLSPEERDRWDTSITSAANWIWEYHWKFPTVSTNYCPTAAVALILAYNVVSDPKESWLNTAEDVVNYVVNYRVNLDGFFTGENVPSGVDMGYGYDQTLGYMLLYGHLTCNDSLIERMVKTFDTHLYFVYPDGSIDNSWGSRTYKWTTYGSKTAPGSQFLCSLIAKYDARAITAGYLNLIYLRKMMKNGWVGYGPHSWAHDPNFKPCNYPTFARATNIALAVEFGSIYGPKSSTAGLPIPSQNTWWYKHFPTVNVIVVRTPKIMATITSYQPLFSSLYLPQGGSISNLWLEDYGFVQTSSQTVYKREEPMHMPIEGELLPLTPRIESKILGVYHTNLYESEGSFSIEEETDYIEVSYSGLLKSRRLLPRCISTSPGIISYTLTHRFYKDCVEKKVSINRPSNFPIIIVEPMVKNPGVTFEKNKASVVAIRHKDSFWQFRVENSDISYELKGGIDESKYWCPFPSLECYPISIIFDSIPVKCTIVYTLSSMSSLNTTLSPLYEGEKRFLVRYLILSIGVIVLIINLRRYEK